MTLFVGVILGVSPPARGEETPPFAWIREFGTPEYEGASNVAADATGVYVIGVTAGNMSGHQNAGLLDVFVRGYSSIGAEAWTRQFGGPDYDIAEAIAVDASGVYVAGGTDSGDAFLWRLGLDGSDQWMRVFGTPYFDLAVSVAASPAGIYVGGQTCGILQGNVDGDCDGFVRQYAPDGTEGWTRQFGGPSADAVRGMAVDATGVYAGGYVFGSLPGQTPNGVNDAFLRKYDFGGTEAWTLQYGTGADESAWAIATDPTGVYVTHFLMSAGGLTDLRKFDANGTVRWSQSAPQEMALYGVAADGRGVVVAGVANPSGPNADAWVLAYDQDGGARWTVQLSTREYDSAYGVAVASDGVYVAGGTDGTLPGQRFEGQGDAYVAKLGETASAVCPLSQGFWKNHPAVWPVLSLTLGRETYDQGELLALLRTPPRGDASVILALQLIAARLNVANGSDPSPVTASLAEADALLAAYAGKLPYGVRPSMPEGRNMTAASEILDAYNNRQLTVSCNGGALRGNAEGADDEDERGERLTDRGTGTPDPTRPPTDTFPFRGWILIVLFAEARTLTLLISRAPTKTGKM